MHYQGPMTKTQPTARVGNLMQLRDTLRLALELAEIGAALAAQAHASAAHVESLRRQIAALREAG